MWKRRLFQLWVLFLLAFQPGCSSFKDTIVNGVPNYAQAFAGEPTLIRLGQPKDRAAWQYVKQLVNAQGLPVTVYKLDDDVEGDDSPVLEFGWTLVKTPLPPEDDKPWSVTELPKPAVVALIVNEVVRRYWRGEIVLWHCVHGRDRTSLISALVAMKLLGWSREQAWHDMIVHGFRWELPDLTAYWLWYSVLDFRSIELRMNRMIEQSQSLIPAVLGMP